MRQNGLASKALIAVDSNILWLAGEGLERVEVGSWRTRHNGRGPLAPIGVLLHHTASLGSAPDQGIVNLVTEGRSDLPGPLCNLLITDNGAVHYVAAGTANHAGMVMASAIQRMRDGHAPEGNATQRGTVGGNSYTIGMEIENNGTGEPYPAVQLRSVATVCARLCEVFGWTSNVVWGHKEMTARKPDPSFDMNEMRTRIGTGDNDMWSDPEKNLILAQVRDLQTAVSQIQAAVSSIQANVHKIANSPATGGGSGASADAVADEIASRLRD